MSLRAGMVINKSRGRATAVALLFALMANLIFRPPGAMIALEDGALTYVICSGGETTTITLSHEGEPDRYDGLGCDFFAAQASALLAREPVVATVHFEVDGSGWLTDHQDALQRPIRPSNGVRGPPLMS